MPSAVPPSFGVCRTHRDRRPGDIPWRSALPGIAGALRRSLLAGGGHEARSVAFGPEAPGSIRRRRRPGFHQPPGLSADARRVLVPFTARIRISGGDGGRTRPGRQAGAGGHVGGIVKRHPVARTRRRRRPGAADSADSGCPSSIARTGGRSCRGSCGWGANDDNRRTDPVAARSDESACSGVAAGQPSVLGRSRPSMLRRSRAEMAERVGFEPTKSCDSALFKSAAFNRSATSPVGQG